MSESIGADLNEHLIGGIPNMNKVDEDENGSFKSNAHMSSYISSIRSRFGQDPSQFIIDPEYEVCGELGKAPDLSKHYRKKVIVVAPHLSFKISSNTFTCGECNSPVTPKAWVSDCRAIQDLDGSVHVMLYQYQCTGKCGCKMHAFSTSEDGTFKMVMPDGLRDLYDITFTHRSGYTSKLMQYIVDCSLTSMSFYSMGSGIQSLRVQRYLTNKKKYYTYVKYFIDDAKRKFAFDQDQSKLDAAISSIKPFSSMHDPKEYNELMRPTDNFIIRLFIDYVSSHRETMEAFMASIPVDDTISIDTMFQQTTIRI